LGNDTPRQRAILFDTNPSFRALCRAIEQHEAFKQEVSDAVEEYFGGGGTSQRIKALIIPKPDPLVEVIKAMQAEPTTYVTTEVYANRINAALEARGFEIREKGQ
jgi:hypothetical protein